MWLAVCVLGSGVHRVSSTHLFFPTRLDLPARTTIFGHLHSGSSGELPTRNILISSLILMGNHWYRNHYILVAVPRASKCVARRFAPVHVCHSA